MEDVSAVCNALKSLKSEEEDILYALTNLKAILGRDCSVTVRASLLENGIVKCIVGLLRCSQNTDVLTGAAGCLSLAIHGCDEVRYKISEMGMVKLCLSLLLPTKEKLSVDQWKFLSVQEQLMSVLRKATCNCKPNHTPFVRHGGIAAVVKLIKDLYSSSIDYYPPSTEKRLSELTVGNCFVAAVSRVSVEQRSSMWPSFPVLSELGGVFTSQYPLFFIDLSDRDQNYISDILINEGLALPDDSSVLSTQSEVQWVILKVTHVSGPFQIWAEFSVDKKSKEHFEMFEKFHRSAPPNSSSSSPPTNLQPGSVYSIYHSPPPPPLDSCTNSSVPLLGGWYRGWLLTPPESSADCYQFFCMDYGFSVSVKMDCIRQLPEQFKGLPPRSAPCILSGLKPPLKSVSLLENCTGLLRNLSFESDDYLGEMVAQGVVPMLFEIVTSKPVTEEALLHSTLCLMNLCQLAGACKLMRQLGAVQILTNVFTSTRHEATVQKAYLGCLINILTLDRESLEIFETINGPSRLRAWMKGEGEGACCQADVEKCVIELLEMFQNNKNGPLPGMSPAAATKSINAVYSPQKNTSHEVSHSPHAKNQQSPVYRVRSTTQDSNSYAVTKECDEGGGVSSLDIPPVKYGYCVSSNTSEVVEYINVEDVLDISMGHMLRSLCGIANADNGGVIYIGVLEDGRAKGVGLNRVEKNNVRLDVDDLVTRLEPSITPSRYNITFIPVTGSPKRKEQYIVRISVSPSSSKAIHIIRKKAGNSGGFREECYIHRNGKSIKISLLDVREIVSEEEARAFKDIVQHQS